MIPLGFELHLTATEQIVLLLVLGLLATAAAVPATAPLAAVGALRARRAGRAGTRNGLWYWLWGTAVTWGTMIGCFNLQLGWWSVPFGWVPGLVAAWLLRPGPLGRLRWEEVRRPVGER
jgi:hypothetical protein